MSSGPAGLCKLCDTCLPKTPAYRYAAAAVFELVTVLLVLPMFWGWWTLGTELTLSPFGIALAFGSPLLSSVNSAVGAKGVVRQLGNVELKYGLVAGEDSKGLPQGGTPLGRLGIARSDHVVGPVEGLRFSA